MRNQSPTDAKYFYHLRIFIYKSNVNLFSVLIPYPPISPISIEYRSNMLQNGAGYSLRGEQLPCKLSSADKVMQKPPSNNEKSLTSNSNPNVIPNQVTEKTTQRPIPVPVDIPQVAIRRRPQNVYFRPKMWSSGSQQYPWVGHRRHRKRPHNHYRNGLKLVKLSKRIGSNT